MFEEPLLEVMGKRGRYQKNDTTKSPKIRARDTRFTEKDMDDEIDTFHKQRDIVPLDVDDDTGSSDEDNVHPVYDIQGSDDDDDDIIDNKQIARIAKAERIMRQKTGGVEDETHDSQDEEEENVPSWVRTHSHGADNVELQSDDEVAEEAEIIKMQKEGAKIYTLEDLGISDQEETASDGEKTIEDILPKTRARSKAQEDKGENDTGTTYEVKKDPNALSRKEQMDVVHSSAPELEGLLLQLTDAVDQLESKVNPLVSKVKRRNDISKEGIRYLETKQALLLAYCQAISFYLLLKSEGNPDRDHPVFARLVEIKNLLDKMKELDDKLPSELEKILHQDDGAEAGTELIDKDVTLTSKPVSRDTGNPSISTKSTEVARPLVSPQLKNGGLSEENKNKQENRKRQISSQSLEMMKVRARIEENLKQKGCFSSATNQLDKSQRIPSRPVNRQLETIDDFGDEVVDKEGGNSNLNNGHATSLHSSLAKLGAKKLNKSKVISGDDDLPKRDDIGERRRKHELRVLSNAGVESEGMERGGEPDIEDEEDGETDGSEDEFYRQVNRQREEKLSAKAELYSRAPETPYMAEPEIVDGKRQITRQIEKNRGLTRARKKLIKNPRKKYKLKHRKSVIARKGQVRDIKKPMGPYGGETCGINAGISRSTRFK